MEEHEFFLRMALDEARRAAEEGEVPIGAVLIRNGEVVATGRNRRETCKNALLHAEIEAIQEGCRKLNTWRMSDCTLYVTLEPCPMCAGAIINARVGKLVYGAKDPKGGACGSVINLFACPFNHRPAVVSGVLEDECSAVLQRFFSGLRG